MNLRMMALMTALTLIPAAGMAQTPGRYDTNIHQRKVDQQARIRQGVHSGELTRGETRHLEGQEHAINHEERAMRRQDGGRLTGYDRRTIHRQQNAESRRIYRDKHNGRVS